ncbi:hypothetical protein ACIQXV_13215 [Neobacillus sp. NPDC097160]|uniref:hypothetical protein n=1 Tax=Neobacillus sp. NPDC097160 TaxID=3364298 RepID=UPI0037F6D19C
MQTIVWAISSMAGLMLIISFLPLGYTLKGKFFIVFVSFILSLGGLAAASTFPMWQTAIILFGLIFFTSYFMNNRMGNLIIKENPIYEEVLEEKFDHPSTSMNVMEIDEEIVVSDSFYQETRSKEKEQEQGDLQEDIQDLSPIAIDVKVQEQNRDTEATFDDSLFDFLLAQNEVASENKEVLDKMDVKEKVSLQK